MLHLANRLALITLLAVSLVSSQVYASDTNTGTASVGPVVCNPATQYCSFVLNMNRTNQPTCAGSDQTFIFATNTEGGRAMLSLLLTSKVSGYQIRVFGTNSCATSQFGINEEMVDYIVTP